MLKSLPFRTLAITALAIMALAASASAKDKPTITQIGRSITVSAGQEVGDVICIACSIRIRGQVSGDAVAVGGSIAVEDEGQVTGDITTVAGSVRLDKLVKVDGDTTVVGGEIRRAPEAQIGGDVTAVGGSGWAPVIIISPVLIVGLLMFVWWLVHRMRRPATPAAV